MVQAPVSSAEVIAGFPCTIPAEPFSIVIFGASGDLTRRKLIPALFDLHANACLAPRFAITGFARTKMSDAEFRESCAQALRLEGARKEKWQEFAGGLSYHGGQFDGEDSYRSLAQHLEALDRQHQLGGNRLFYLAVPPEVYPAVIEQLGRTGLSKPSTEKSFVRIIVEKPFGNDLASARALNRQVLAVFDESQVYRIDHYLGKETVQNLLVFRFGNGIFEPLWNRNYIDHVQITAAETLGVERRASFYESTGAVRDMVQSHLMQLLALVAMEPPATFESTPVRNEKLKVLQSIRPLTPQAVAADVVRGQYAAGKVDGKSVPAYRDEPGVDKNSATETFAAARLWIDNWRWAGVPFCLRTGKRLPRRVTEIAIQFRRAPHLLFRGRDLAPNRLVLNIQPEEGISLSFDAKLPGPEMLLKEVTMDFCYRTAFGASADNAYATLLNDCMRGDATLFDRADTVEAAWELVQPILDAWRDAKPTDFPNYPAGTWGPPAAGKLLEDDGRHWRNQ